MRLRLAFKTLLRSAARTALTVILLGAVAFALISQAMEHAITDREAKAAAAQYYGVGSVQAAAPDVPAWAYAGNPYHLTLESGETGVYQLLTQEQVDAVLSLPYVSSYDMRLMTAGVSNDHARLDDGAYFFNFSMRCVVEATVYREIESYESGDVNYFVNEANLLAGFVKSLSEKPTMQTCDADTLFIVYGLKLPYTAPDSSFLSILYGGRTRSLGFYFPGIEYGCEQLNNMKVGDRCAFVLRFMPIPESEQRLYDMGDFIYEMGDYVYCIGDYMSNSWCEAVWPLNDAPEGYLELDEYAPLRELIEITDADAHTLDVVYTEDMRSIMRFAEGKMEVAEGRMVGREDSAAGAAVCCVSSELAEEYGLCIGDTISLALGGRLFEQYANLGAVAGTRERYAPPVGGAELEIVGIYVNTDTRKERSADPHWGYSVNAVFVPRSLLPEGAEGAEGHSYAPGEFSFMIEDARDIPAFLEEAEPMLREMGLTLVFNDRGWLAIEEEFAAASRAAAMKIAAYSAAAIAATCLAAYLFIARRKRDYAVMRALGTGRGKAARSLALPFLAVALTSVALGGAAACMYVMRTVGSSNALVALERYAADSSVPAGALALGAMAVLALALAAALAMLRRIGKTAPLALLHGGATGGQRLRFSTARGGGPRLEHGATRPNNASDGAGYDLRINSTSSADARAAPYAGGAVRGRAGPLFAARHAARHIRRSAAKSVLSVAVALLLVSAIAQLSAMRGASAELVASTPVKAYFVGGITLPSIREIAYSRYAAEVYYSGESRPVDIFAGGERHGPVVMCVTNDIGRYSGMGGAIVTYAEKHGASSMGYLNPIVIIGRLAADEYGVSPGDVIDIAPAGAEAKAASEFLERHRAEDPGDASTDAEVLEANAGKVAEIVRGWTRTFTVAGIVEAGMGDPRATAVYAPGVSDAEQLFGPVELLEVSLRESDESDAFRSYARGKMGAGVTMSMDTSRLENVRNSHRMIEMLYPMAVAAALLIGAFMCSLMVLQTSLEAAVMRVLGTGRALSAAVLSAQQAAPCAIGLAAGLCCVAAFIGGGDAASGVASGLAPGLASGLASGQAALFAALYLAVALASSAVCSGIATRRPPLELLQVRE